MLTKLIEEARHDLHDAQDKAYTKFDEYMSAPFDGKDRERELAMDEAWKEMHTAEGVLAGIQKAQAFLTAQMRATA